MRKAIVRLILPLMATVFAMSACSQKEDNRNSLLSGEWKLSEVGGVPASDLLQDEIGGLDIYVVFDGNGMFETFQRLGDSHRYVRYSGTYSVSGTTASGQYDDGTPWGASYTVRTEEDGAVLVMTANGEDCVYDKASVPEDVRTNAVDPVVSKSSDNAVIPPRFL